MKARINQHPASDGRRTRVLLVADWTVEPEAVIAACLRHAALKPAHYSLLVPARLRGVDWVGDPAASAPCARRQLARLSELAEAADLSFSVAGVGDPNVLAAIGDALIDAPADELMLCSAARRLAVSHALGLRRRARRLTGLEVAQVRLPVRADASGPRLRPRLGGHCTIEQPLVA